MTIPDGPTLGEVARLVQAMSVRLDRLSEQITQQQEQFHARYLPRAEFDLAQQSDSRQLLAVENGLRVMEHTFDEYRRQIIEDFRALDERARTVNRMVWTSLVFPVVLVLVTVAVTRWGGQ